jgi:hypothetical protein
VTSCERARPLTPFFPFWASPTRSSQTVTSFFFDEQKLAREQSPEVGLALGGVSRVESSTSMTSQKSLGSVPDMEELDRGDLLEDVRMELRSIDTNFTSVLMNPRESIYDLFMDDIWDDWTQELSGASSSNTLSTSSHHSSSHHSESISNEELQLYQSSVRKEKFRESYQQFTNIHRNQTWDRNNQRSGARSAANNFVSSNELEESIMNVPDLFFRSDFSLKRPPIFNQVINPSDMDDDVQLQNLNDYLDTVENSLLRQIWTRSDAIFQALDDIKGQRHHVSQAIDRLLHLRSDLKALDKRIAVSAIHIPKMHRRMTNESLLHSKLVIMQQVIQGLGSIRALMETGDYLGAFEMIADSRKLYLSDLQDLKCMATTSQQLDAYDVLVCEIISNKFVSVAIEWENDKEDLYGGGSSSDSITSEEIKTSSALLGGVSDKGLLDDEGSDQLWKLTHALLIIGRLSPAFAMYKSRLIESLRQIIKTCVTEYLSDFDPSLMKDDSGDGDSAPFDKDRIKSMPTDKFISCLIMCFENLISALERAHGVHNFIMSYIGYAENDNNNNNNNNNNNDRAFDANQAENLKNLSHTCLIAACDMSQRALAQLLSLKKNDMARVTLEKMKDMWVISTNFINSVEQISDSSAVVIGQALHAQTSQFLSNMHERNKLSVISTMDHETWVQCSVPREIQQEIDRLNSGKMFTKLIGESGGGNEQKEIGTEHEKQKKGNGTSLESMESNFVLVDGVQFRVVWSALSLITTIFSYLNIAVSFPSVAKDVVSMIKDLLELFNKSSHMLVLGSGAQKSLAQLRSITAKHLTATAQSLAVLMALLPHIRTVLLAQLPPNYNVLLTDLDRVSQEMVNHHGDILTKFVNILGDSMESSYNKLRGVKWDEYAGKCEYFEDIIKNVTALHRILIIDGLLPFEQSQDIFSRVFSMLVRKLQKHFNAVSPTTDRGKEAILKEVTQLGMTLSNLDRINTTKQIDEIQKLFGEMYAITTTASAASTISEGVKS